MSTADTDRDMGDLGLALRRLTRPLIKVLIARGVTAPVLYRMIKGLYVEVAERDFRLDGAVPTDSRISVLTGVHRKDVRSLRQAGSRGEPAVTRTASLMATVIGRWLAAPEFTDADGRPRPLARQPGDGPSFEGLVRAISTDVRPRTVLDELLRQGVVRLDEDSDQVTLSAEALIDRDDGEDRFHFFALNLGDHLSAAGENVLADGEAPFLERAVFYNNLTPDSLDRIEVRAGSLAKTALADLNRFAYSRQQADDRAEAASHRFRFGVYFYREDEEAATGPGDGGPGDGVEEES